MFTSQPLGLSRRAFFLPGPLLRLTVTLACALLFCAATSSVASAAPLYVNSCSDLQTKIGQANFGDTIIVNANLHCRGQQLITLPYKGPGSGNDADYITIQSSELAALPEGRRVGPADAIHMPTLESIRYEDWRTHGDPVIRTEPRAHHWRLLGLNITADPTADMTQRDLITLGDGDGLGAQDTLDEVPQYITIDRCYIHVGPTHAVKRGIALNSARTTIKNSYIAGFKLVAGESHAICMWNGPGRYLIENNYLEAAGVNVMLLGSGNKIPGLIPSDIEFRRNHFSKQTSWRPGDPNYDHSNWEVKNLLELKTGKRVLIDGNLMEYAWKGTQNGVAVLFNPLSHPSGEVAQLEDIVFTNNIVRHAAGGMLIDGMDDDFNPNSHTWKVIVRNNLFEDISPVKWGGTDGGAYGRLFSVNQNTDSVTIEHNTGFNYNSPLPPAVRSDAGGNTYFISRNNIFRGDVTSQTTSTAGDVPLRDNFPAAIWTNNVQIGGGLEVDSNGNPGKEYAEHPDNEFPATDSAVGFVDYAGGNYRLAASSPYKGKATDGKDIGVDMDALIAAQNGTALPSENVVWTKGLNVAVTDNTLTKSATTSAWDAGASSTRAIAAGDGYVDFTVGEKINHRMCGLSHGDTNRSFQEIDYAIYPNFTGRIYIYENGTQIKINNNNGIFGTYEPGNRFRVSIESGYVKYYKNDELLYTHSVTPDYPLRVDTTLWSPGATIQDVILGGRDLRPVLPTADVVWTNAVNVTVSGNTLTKVGTVGAWNSGASSTKALYTGEGYVECYAGETTTHKMCGLSSDDADQRYQDIDFAIYPNASGLIYIYEGGNPVVVNGNNGIFGKYTTGTRLSVGVEGGYVTYRRDGVLLYTSRLATFPLRVDTTLWSPGASIRNVTVVGNFQ